MKCARRAATQRNYSSGARKYIKFCGFLDANPFVPISEENLAMCAILFCHDCSVHTLASWLSAVENFCRLEKLPKLPKGTDYYEVVAGLKNIYGQVDIQKPATAFDWSDLVLLHAGIDFGCLADVQFWCATILGFQGLFRASEIGRVQLDHIEINAWGVRVTVLFSKTNPSPVPVTMVARGDAFALF